jgi:hypothetical protein
MSLFRLLSSGFTEGTTTPQILTAPSLHVGVPGGGKATSAAVPLGPAFVGREIWVCSVAHNSYSAHLYVSTAVISGTQMQLVHELSRERLNISFFKLTDNGTLGTTGNVTVNYTSNTAYSGFAAFISTPTTNMIGSAGRATRSRSTSYSTPPLTEGDGWSFYMSVSDNSVAGTSSDFDNDQAFDLRTNEWACAAYNSPSQPGQIVLAHHTGWSSGRTLSAAISME